MRWIRKHPFLTYLFVLLGVVGAGRFVRVDYDSGGLALAWFAIVGIITAPVRLVSSVLAAWFGPDGVPAITALALIGLLLVIADIAWNRRTARSPRAA